MLRQFSSRPSSHWVQPSHVGQGQESHDDNVPEGDSKDVLLLANTDISGSGPQEDFRSMLDADDFKRPEDQRFFEALEDHDLRESAERLQGPEGLQGPAGYMEYPDVRVIDFALRANSKKAQSASRALDAAHLIEPIVDIDGTRAKRKLRDNLRVMVRVKLRFC